MILPVEIRLQKKVESKVFVALLMLMLSIDGNLMHASELTAFV